MTDFPTPEGDLTAAESEELLLMCGHAAGPEPLSPAAQAVLDAVCDNTEPDCDTQHLIAAALRAAAEQCQIEWNYHPDYPETEWVVVASDLTAIADELEGQDQLTKESV